MVVALIAFRHISVLYRERLTVRAELEAQVHGVVVLEGEGQSGDGGVRAAVQDVALLLDAAHQAVPQHQVLVDHLQRVAPQRYLMPHLPPRPP